MKKAATRYTATRQHISTSLAEPGLAFLHHHSNDDEMASDMAATTADVMQRLRAGLPVDAITQVQAALDQK